MSRPDGRRANQLRNVQITPDFSRYAEGSVLVEFGETRVICTASVDNKVPSFLEGQGKGWVTAEYAMLPRATHTRSGRNPGGRGQEIQRLIGRALRTAVNMKKLGARQIIVDCDVIQADGGTRTAAVTGGWVALAIAVGKVVKREKLTHDPMRLVVSAVSTGIIDGEARLDLAYAEDSNADVDCNFVITDDGRFVEIQGTAEAEPFSPEDFSRMSALATAGAQELVVLQRQALAAARAL